MPVIFLIQEKCENNHENHIKNVIGTFLICKNADLALFSTIRKDRLVLPTPSGPSIGKAQNGEVLSVFKKIVDRVRDFLDKMVECV